MQLSSPVAVVLRVFRWSSFVFNDSNAAEGLFVYALSVYALSRLFPNRKLIDLSLISSSSFKIEIRKLRNYILHKF